MAAFSVSSCPWGTHVTVFQFVHEGIRIGVQPYTAGSRAGCPRDLDVLVRVRHTSSCRVISELCGPRAMETPSLTSSGLTGRAVSSTSFQPPAPYRPRPTVLAVGLTGSLFGPRSMASHWTTSL